MKRAILYSTAFAVLLCLSGLPLMAQVHAGGVPGGMGQRPGMGQEPGTGNGPQMGHGLEQNQQPGMGNRMPNGRTRMPRMHHLKTLDEKLAQNTRLSSSLKPLLPSGENVLEAANGFKNLGQFVAAVHVSHNLNIPFNKYKSKVTSGDSLGKAVHSLKPTMTHKQVKSVVKQAKHEAKRQIKASHS